MEQNNVEEKNKDAHMCKHGECCDDCCTCGCHRTKGKSFWTRIALLSLGVILAFWCGYKLGIIKGFIMSNFGGMHMRYEPKMHMMPVPHITPTTTEHVVETVE